MWKVYTDMPLFQKLLLAFALISCLTVLLVYLNFNRFYEDKRSTTLHMLESANQQAASTIEGYLLDVGNLLKMPYILTRNDRSFIAELHKFNESNEVSFELKSMTDEIFFGMHELKSDIQSEFLFNLNGAGIAVVYDESYLGFPYNPSDEPWFRETIERRGMPVIVGTRHVPGMRDKYGGGIYSFGVARAVIDYQAAEPVGIVLANTNMQLLGDFIRPMLLTPSQRIVLADDNGLIVFDSASDKHGILIDNLLASIIKSDQAMTRQMDIIGTKLEIPNTGWTLINMVPEKELYEELNSMTQLTVLLTFGTLLFTILLLSLLTWSIVKPIRELMTNMKRLELGDFQTGEPTRRRDELGLLTNHFHKTTFRIKQLIDEVYVEKLTQKELELQMLQYQINPHFLYNTLESIQMMAYINKDRDTAGMVQSLGKIMRYSISSKDELVTLEEELAMLKEYVKLQERRFDELFAIVIDVPKELEGYTVPKLMLQPIVENAIYHGLRKKEQGGLIEVRGKLQGDELLLAITDNGTGMTVEESERLASYIEGNGEQRGSIGLRNVNKRIKLYFGDVYGVTIISHPGQGTEMRIKLPAWNAEGDSHDGQ